MGVSSSNHAGAGRIFLSALTSITCACLKGTGNVIIVIKIRAGYLLSKMESFLYVMTFQSRIVLHKCRDVISSCFNHWIMLNCINNCINIEIAGKWHFAWSQIIQDASGCISNLKWDHTAKEMWGRMRNIILWESLIKITLNQENSSVCDDAHKIWNNSHAKGICQNPLKTAFRNLGS